MISKRAACLSQVCDEGRRLEKSMKAKIKECQGVNEDKTGNLKKKEMMPENTCKQKGQPAERQLLLKCSTKIEAASYKSKPNVVSSEVQTLTGVFIFRGPNSQMKPSAKDSTRQLTQPFHRLF